MSQKLTYYQKISLNNKTQEEADEIMKLFEANMNIANKVASKYYKTKYWDYDEALQIARMGLWKACLIWDPEKYRLSTLAYNIINRDFIDFDKEQKRQPDVLFNLEETCVTEDLSLNDVLVDESVNVDDELVDDESIRELNQDIIYILEDIADDLDIPKSYVKMTYLVFIESNTDKKLNLNSIRFIKRQTVKQIIDELQKRLKEIL